MSSAEPMRKSKYTMKMWSLLFSLFAPGIVLLVWAALTAVSAETGTLIGRIALGIALFIHGCAEWKLHKIRKGQHDA